MDLYVPTSDKEFSQRKLEEYAKFAKVIAAGRNNPIWFSEEFFGIKLMDYQKWCFMESWYRPYCLWLECRGAGKSTLAAIFLQTKLILIPDYKVYISTNSAQQSIETFLKLENIALQRIPSFKTCTDIFAQEVYKSANSETGFLHNPAGYSFRLFNNSELVTLSSNLNTIRGKRGSVLYDETAFQSAESINTTENFANVDSNFGLGTGKIKHLDPMQMPLQLLYASSAGDVTYPFFEKYKSYSYKMFLGDSNYFVCDINANTVINFSTVDGEKIKSHLTKDQIDKQIEDDPDLADRELFNKFRKGGGSDAVIRMDTIIRNSTVRRPLLQNETGKDKFIFCYDPARNFDGSVLSIYRVINDPSEGYKLSLENVVSMVDPNTKHKTPLPMPEQIDIIRQLMIDYNGERAADWENIEFYCDAGAGGGGVSAVADSLMQDFVDSNGRVRRGIIDPVHKQYESSRQKYVNATFNMHLIEPKSYKVIIYDALEKMSKLNLINFPDYDGKDYLLLIQDDGEPIEYQLSFKERLALVHVNIMKNEVIYMCRCETPTGGVTYELSKDKKNVMHDDHAYTLAMGAYALSVMRRDDLTKPVASNEDDFSFTFRAPKIK